MFYLEWQIQTFGTHWNKYCSEVIHCSIAVLKQRSSAVNWGQCKEVFWAEQCHVIRAVPCYQEVLWIIGFYWTNTFSLRSWPQMENWTQLYKSDWQQSKHRTGENGCMFLSHLCYVPEFKKKIIGDWIFLSKANRS